MSLVNLDNILSLVYRANDHGVKLSVADENLSIKFLKNKPIDQKLLAEIKFNKVELISYLKMLAQEHSVKDVPDAIPVITYLGRSYYKTTSTQQYWLNKNVDSEYKLIDKNHGSKVDVLEVEGSLDLEVLRTAVRYITIRHESLRSNFHCINNEYFLRVEDEKSDTQNFELIDLSDLSTDGQIEELSSFNDHQFDLQSGPLFLLRVIKLNDKRYIISQKIHHIISDNWSGEILTRDLFVSYLAISRDEEPILPALTHQLKESSHLINSYIEKNLAVHKQYWKELCPEVPQELYIPILQQIKREESAKFSGFETFSFEKEIVSAMASIAKRTSASFFVILQALFKKFLSFKTGQTDIIIGTYVFGRDYHVFENIIGCFAKTALIRTKFNTHDSLTEVIEKVKKSNEDMQFYKAHSLFDTLVDMESKDNITGSYWKVNLHFSDSSKSYYTKISNFDLPISIKLLPEKHSNHVPIDFQFNFNYENEILQVGVEYDSCLYRSSDVKKMVTDYSDYAKSVLITEDLLSR